MWDKVFNAGFFVSLFAASVRLSAPILLAALGQIFTQRAGVLNLNVEGTMVLCSMVAFSVTYGSGSLIVGTLAAILAGALWSMLFGLFAVTLRSNQVIAGIGLNILSVGVATYLYRVIFGVRSLPPQVDPYPVVLIPGLADIPFLGPVFFQHNALVYVSYVLVPLIWWLMQKTTYGLRIKIVGEHPRAADTKGIRVGLIRCSAIMLGGAFAGAAGAFMSTAYMNLYTEGLVGGRGFMAVSVVIFAKFHPIYAMFGALLFGFSSALQMRLQAVGVNVANQLLLMLPYVMTIIALVSTSRRARMPAAFTKPYSRMER